MVNKIKLSLIDIKGFERVLSYILNKNEKGIGALKISPYLNIKLSVLKFVGLSDGAKWEFMSNYEIKNFITILKERLPKDTLNKSGVLG